MRAIYNNQILDISSVLFRNNTNTGIYRTGEIGGELIIEANEDEFKEMMVGIDMSIYCKQTQPSPSASI